ncbi:deoxyribose-phosphate aldolase [Pseudovirgaria hyperparasitica]|uniref:deoxyribose-phosphate aldolase n=1 Tax=Pseudovirgaria hyperparasitica TaxID=470096 RepID=A0A6A6W8R4_9PEZI|nr:deoxyribose-phosphate aldolase [Pseudovirgaria hyperparasitica]KAF2757471.1 deoxyribose-phosphate aldolase [Pseudovirgaria hyperparasitica]
MTLPTSIHNSAVEKAIENAKTLSPFTDADWLLSIKAAAEHIKPSDDKITLNDVGPKAIAKTIDHTLLKLDATEAQIRQLCVEAKEDDFMSVCVRLPHVPLCASLLSASTVLIACVIGFHEGTYSTPTKVAESIDAVRAGASELDVVLNWPALQSGQYSSIFTELAAIRLACPHPTTLKIIFETSQLSESGILAACQLAAAAGFDFVKTSTGFNGRGASVRDVQLMRAASKWYASDDGVKLLRKAGKSLGTKVPMKVKASGGVRTFADAVKMLEIGAERIGASSGKVIVKEAKEGKTSSGAAAGAESY